MRNKSIILWVILLGAVYYFGHTFGYKLGYKDGYTRSLQIQEAGLTHEFRLKETANGELRWFKEENHGL